MRFVEKDKILERIDTLEISMYLADGDGQYDNDDWFSGSWYDSDGYDWYWQDWKGLE
jgi:hypothetical protein